MLEWRRPAEQVTLPEFATHPDQRVALRHRLDAFRDDLDAERPRERKDSDDDGRGRRRALVERMTELAEKTGETAAIHTVMGRNRVCIDSLATSSSPLRSVMTN